MIAHVATVVAIEGRGVMIEGAPGSGKSALALALIDRGAFLVGDDGVMLEATETAVIARPHPRTRGLLEIRNLGLVPVAVCEQVEVTLVIRLDPQAPRFVEAAHSVERIGVALPCIALWPDPSPPVLKVEQALRLYGRPMPVFWT
ncbi:serine kinase of HPr protein (carbohydrate metabolism regulator) [Novosphingobium chloroacetimidivorans]|uniref:Serine kinase of HPr protein (Carbohydrate metabolism regulator) n=1 Tax=Novosphingobium chloroacetimidivorans TaxID=1428314 RepID=A0A7W7KAP7_9SPHN|nr:HPr kinase/phosphatase C-terminal domain-containing protein [Novosphingobium chloroacetimidivorans]MBB4859021.1 serine kinase of HPr protein (carbohydrate metabolism regulator) [Novosphingobium chloroacetimidivorans]